LASGAPASDCAPGRRDRPRLSLSRATCALIIQA